MSRLPRIAERSRSRTSGAAADYAGKVDLRGLAFNTARLDTR